MELIIFLLCAFAATHIIVNEYVFEWFRKLIEKTKFKPLIKLVNCVTCMGFWTGIVLGLLFGNFFGLHWFLCGLASSAINYIMGLINIKFFE